MSWIAEHGREFAVPALVLNLEGIQDLSWHNDACPRFAVTDDGVGPNLWVDHPFPHLRETGGERFTVIVQPSENSSSDDTLIHSGDDVVAAVAAFIAAVVDWHAGTDPRAR